jgi:hypothetical protein
MGDGDDDLQRSSGHPRTVSSFTLDKPPQRGYSAMARASQVLNEEDVHEEK